MLRKYTFTQVTRQLNEIYHICIFILEGACMDLFTLRNVYELTSNYIFVALSGVRNNGK